MPQTLRNVRKNVHEIVCKNVTKNVHDNGDICWTKRGVKCIYSARQKHYSHVHTAKLVTMYVNV